MTDGHEARSAHRERHETLTEQLDRNWSDLLQDLRVAQTGVQLLTGLLSNMRGTRSCPPRSCARHSG